MTPMTLLAVMMTAIATDGAVLHAAAVRTEVVRTDGRWQLLRDGKPYLIKGAGGGGSKQLLSQVGGNSFRTWGTRNLAAQLDEAHKLGLTVTVGLWMPQDGRGAFRYEDERAVAEHLEQIKQEILTYKDHSAVLIWAIGNEMEGYGKGDNPAVWKAVNNVARMIRQVDPDHPTMTVIAELGGERLKNFIRYCPDVQILGVNSYARAPTIAQRYVDGGGTKPYIVTEFGPAGIWEIKKNAFGMYPEQTSTQKGEVFRKAWKENVDAHPEICLGAYAFLWGNKQEATSTWFGMILPDGARLESVDVMTELWTGKPPANRVPDVEPIEVQDKQPFAPGQVVNASAKITDPDGDPLAIEWTLVREQTEFKTGGEPEKPTAAFADAIARATDGHVEVKMPTARGGYRIFVYVRDGHGGGATANVPVYVESPPPTSQP